MFVYSVSGHLHLSGEDEVAVFRRRLAKRKSKALAFARDARLHVRLMMLSCVTVHIEQLMSVMDAEDVSLLDLLHTDHRNPFVKAEEGICALIAGGGAFDHALQLIEPEMVDNAVAVGRALSLEMLAQMRFRFRHYLTFPYKLVKPSLVITETGLGPESFSKPYFTKITHSYVYCSTLLLSERACCL